MTADIKIEDKDDRLLVEAAEWLVRLASGDATETDAHELGRWRAQSLEHDQAFRKVASVHMLTRAVAENPAPVLDRRAVLTGGAMLGVAVATFGVVKPPFSLWPSLAELMADHRTGAGERYAFNPVAGVTVEMNSRTSVSLIDNNHGISLIRGEAFVAAPRQAFTIQAGDNEIVTESATMNVQMLGEALRVACTLGKARCRRGNQEDSITAGEQLTFDAGGARRRRIDPAKAAAWRQGLLIFEGTPLAEVIEEINLYRPGRIVLTDTALARRSVNGVFHTDRIENTVEQIRQALGLHARHLPGGVLLMG